MTPLTDGRNIVEASHLTEFGLIPKTNVSRFCAIPTPQNMRKWSQMEHNGISRPQICSLRPKVAMDAVFLGENRFSLTAVEGLAPTTPGKRTMNHRSRYGELVLTFTSVKVELKPGCGESATFSYDEIDEWMVVNIPGTGPRAPSGLELWVLPDGGEGCGQPSASGGNGGVHEDRPNGGSLAISSEDQRRRVFLGLPDEDLILARNGMEYFWNRRRAELHLPPKAGSTHGRSVASMITLRGQVKAPVLPTGRIDPIDLGGVEIRVGQLVQPSPRRGQLNLLPSPRALLGVEKKRILRHNARSRSQWELVVLHQGWLRKRGGGAIKRWIWRYFVLFDTPQGHFLAYYNDASEVPLFSEAHRERKLIDLCKVCFLRPEIGRAKHPGLELPPNAFSIVTTERHWTLCADSKLGVQEWLRMLSVAIDEDVAVVDDGEALFHVKAHWSINGSQYGPENSATVHLGCMGMELRLGSSDSITTLGGFVQSRRHSGGGEGGASSMISGKKKFWSFTDFYKWTLVALQEGMPGLAIECFTDDKFDKKEVRWSLACVQQARPTRREAENRASQGKKCPMISIFSD